MATLWQCADMLPSCGARKRIVWLGSAACAHDECDRLVGGDAFDCHSCGQPCSADRRAQRANMLPAWLPS